MSNDSIVDMFESEKGGDNNNWKKTGHFCIRFTKEGVDEFVIVDDYIPLTFLDGEFKPAFTKGGRDGKEIWPCIIEKAYAKWYSSYSIIESGKIPLALSDMNPWGVSEQMPLKDMANSTPDAFWKLIKSLGELGKESMLGGGSPEHPDGDHAFSPDGIVMNHAYAILRIE